MEDLGREARSSHTQEEHICKARAVAVDGAGRLNQRPEPRQHLLQRREVEVMRIQGVAVEDDAHRRDFTMNALYADPRGEVIDPVGGLVQVPCIERNAFGAVKAHTAASLALLGSGEHFMPLDNCIAAMKQTGLEMSHKFKETSLGGLAVSFIEC